MNTQHDKIEIKPLIRRLIFIRLPFVIVISVLVFVLMFMVLSSQLMSTTFLLGYLLPFAILSAVVYVLTFYVPVFLRSTISITDEEMTGHTGRGWRRCRIPLDKIDMARSREQNRVQKIFGDRYVYSVDGERICIDGQFFSQRQSRRVLEILQTRLNSMQPKVNAIE